MPQNGVYGIDTANLMLEDLTGPIRRTFLRRMYGPAKLCKKVKPTGEAFSSRRLMTKHASRGKQLYDGTEVLPMVRDTGLFEVIKWAPMTFMVPIYLLGMDVDKAKKSKTKIGELMKEGPAADLERLAIDLEEFVLTGRTFHPGTPVMAAADLANLNPFLGEFVNPNNGTGNARLGTDYGALKFETPAVQTANGHKWLDLARNEAKGWYNQHAAITTFASDGEEKIQTLQRRLMQRSSDNTAADRMLCTDGLFANILKTQRDAVRIVKAEQDHYLKTGEAEITMYGGIAIETNASFDVAQLAQVDAKFANGAAYLFNTHNGKWEYEEDGPLKFSPFRDVLDNQYRYTARLIHTCQVTCQELKAQGTILGGITKMAAIDFVDLDITQGHGLLTAVDTSPTYPLGRVRVGVNAGGVQEWVYIRNTSGSTLAVGEGVMFAAGYNDFEHTALSAAGCPRPRFIGVAQHAIAHNSYGWVQRKGLATIKSTAGVNANTSIKPVNSGVFTHGTMGTDDLFGAVGAAINAGDTGLCYLAG